MTVHLARAKINFAVDVNVGDPIWPGPSRIGMPRLLGGTIELLGYPLVMIFAEKIVTMIQRSTLNARWRDFADVYVLASHHSVAAAELRMAIEKVAAYRAVSITQLRDLLADYPMIAQSKWDAWLRKEGYNHLPANFLWPPGQRT